MRPLTCSALILLLCLTASRGFDLQGNISPDPKNFLKKYALLKLHESCFGQEAMFKMKEKTREAARYCNSQPVSLGDFLDPENEVDAPAQDQVINRNFFLQKFVAPSSSSSSPSSSLPGNGQKADANIKKGWTKKWKARKSPSPSSPLHYNFIPYPWSGTIHQRQQHHHFQQPHLQQPSPFILTPTYAHHPHRGHHHPRHPRQTASEEETQLSALREDVLARLSNVTCALRRLGVARADGAVDTERVRKEYEEMPGLDPLMREEIVHSVGTCARFSTCLSAETAFAPTSSTSSSLLTGGSIAPLIMFVNCFKGKKMESCIKKDLRERLAQFVVQSDSSDSSIFADELLSSRAGDRMDQGLDHQEEMEGREDMEKFLFAILYEDEPKDLI